MSIEARVTGNQRLVVGFALAGAGTNWGLANAMVADGATRCRPAPMASAS